MVALVAYFDDTGTHEGSQIMGLGGCIATVENWDNLAQEWAAFLDDWGLDFFHMKDAESKQREYREWTDEQRDRRIGMLARLVDKTVTLNAAAMIEPALYKQHITAKMSGIHGQLSDHDAVAAAKNMMETQGSPYFPIFRVVSL